MEITLSRVREVIRKPYLDLDLAEAISKSVTESGKELLLMHALEWKRSQREHDDFRRLALARIEREHCKIEARKSAGG
jgi:hypothetical protein